MTVQHWYQPTWSDRTAKRLKHATDAIMYDQLSSHGSLRRSSTCLVLRHRMWTCQVLSIMLASKPATSLWYTLVQCHTVLRCAVASRLACMSCVTCIE